ncbi:hypothetical protein BDP27DRAFT_1329004 [Rhodocollybia butyracea]|uniref:F-box domain-containing protein n=1 Tax=Rhodocollybia butyracea TaxID=206335 RepID=A0A9P5PQ14_9AGAR|nr:hypothetical protein BDP27DRAFT_1329004 [Rhodocollybia butyracea]
MSRRFGFDLLPNELCHLILEELDYPSLCSLSRVSKRAYAAFAGALYESVQSPALFTLASSEKSRLPLSGPHPASFVRRISLSFPDRPSYSVVSKHKEREEKAKNDRMEGLPPSDLTTFKQLVTKAVNNVIFYAPNAAIKSFRYECDLLSLPDVFPNVEFAKLSSLEKVTIECPFPIATLRRSLAIISSLCGSSLEGLNLTFPGRRSHGGVTVYPPEPSTIAKVLQKVPESCPQIQRLTLYIPGGWSNPDISVKPIHRALANPTFTFPNLKELHLVDITMVESICVECSAFFLRHPNVETFVFCGASLHRGHPVDPRIFPKLSMLRVALLGDCVSLCLSGARPIDTLILTVGQTISKEKELQLITALKSLKTLRVLRVRDLRITSHEELMGISIDNLTGIVTSCPHLTHFDCVVGIEAAFNLPDLHRCYNDIVSNLPSLDCLMLGFCFLLPATLGYPYTDPSHIQVLQEVMQKHRAPQTIQVELFEVSALCPPQRAIAFQIVAGDSDCVHTSDLTAAFMLHKWL